MSERREKPLLAPRRVEWTPDLSTGVEEIDAQHRELYSRVNRFLEALVEKRARNEVGPLLVHLQSYAREHFAAEEKMMELAGFAGLGEHLAEHHRFEVDCARLSDELEADGPTYGMAKELTGMLVDWLAQHIGETDRRFGLYLTRRRSGAKPVPSA